ncbi:RNB domain-containing ribonuclease [Corynebacterium diphtheriae]|nr:RNB domain-containing ribonuclease [Corynebacterium diphtheriae]
MEGFRGKNGAMKLYAHPLDFSAIAEEFHISTEFPSDVISAARELDDQFAGQRRDMRDYEFVTIDPAGSMDLDQAVVITNHNDGYTVYYAIADVAAFVEFDAPRAVADESLRRGQTIYLPDQPARLHPAELSEDRASLLPDCNRPAVVWTINLDAFRSAAFSLGYPENCDLNEVDMSEPRSLALM